jgi:UDP-N-acetylglucosamine--N-acetylmuramyl-(pentapeptide) pyrophosphoryl-undecaprenol N-acetylglucosamine transferase
VEGIKGKGSIRVLKALFKIPVSLVQAFRIIREFSPDIVIGVGGYASGPVVIAAHFMGIKTAIAEQNALPGITNRILGKFVDRVFLTFSETGGWFSEKKAALTGNPIRQEFFLKEKEERKSAGRFTLLIFGGSQGAHRINMAMLDALKYLKEMKDRLKVIHQTGSKDLKKVSMAYQDCGMDAEVLPFINDMASVYQSADLLICRAGATSIAEITASGKAAILIPFPFAASNHQVKNAEVLINTGAAEMILDKDLNGELLAEVILRLYRDSKKIKEMEEKSRELGSPRAAEDIVDVCMELAALEEE